MKTPWYVMIALALLASACGNSTAADAPAGVLAATEQADPADGSLADQDSDGDSDADSVADPDANTESPGANTDANTEPSSGDSTDDPDSAYCQSLERFFAIQVHLIEENFGSEAEYGEATLAYAAATDSAIAVAPESHVELLQGYKVLVDEISTLTSEEYLNDEELLEESGRYLLDELFVVNAHAVEVCGIDTDFDIDFSDEESAAAGGAR